MLAGIETSMRPNSTARPIRVATRLFAIDQVRWGVCMVTPSAECSATMRVESTCFLHMYMKTILIDITGRNPHAETATLG
jgi:hypothetical protein